MDRLAIPDYKNAKFLSGPSGDRLIFVVPELYEGIGSSRWERVRIWGCEHAHARPPKSGYLL